MRLNHPSSSPAPTYPRLSFNRMSTFTTNLIRGLCPNRSHATDASKTATSAATGSPRLRSVKCERSTLSLAFSFGDEPPTEDDVDSYRATIDEFSTANNIDQDSRETCLASAIVAAVSKLKAKNFPHQSSCGALIWSDGPSEAATKQGGVYRIHVDVHPAQEAKLTTTRWKRLKRPANSSTKMFQIGADSDNDSGDESSPPSTWNPQRMPKTALAV